MMKSLHALWVTFVVGLISHCVLVRAEPIAQEKEILVGVEYFAGWWTGRGSKWESSGKDWRPEYPDRLPLLGEDNSQELMDKEIIAAAEHGVDFFSILWYYPKNAPGTEHLCEKLNSGLDFFMSSPHSDKMKFMIELTNHEPFGIISNEDWDDCMKVCINAMKHPSYLRIDGRAVMKIHGLHQFYIDLNQDAVRAKDVLGRIRKIAADAGVGELLIALGTYGIDPIGDGHFFVESGGIDANMQYMEFPNLPLSEDDYPYQQLVDHSRQLRGIRENDRLPWVPYFPCGWNPRPWEVKCPCFALPTDNELKTAFEGMKSDLLESKNLGFPKRDGTVQRAFTVYAWNEYAEGGFLTPSRNDKYRKLEILKEVFVDAKEQ